MRCLLSNELRHAEKSMAGASVPEPSVACGRRTIKGRNSGETGGASEMLEPQAGGILEETGKTMRFPETSLAGITRIGCKGFLSASSRAGSARNACEAPLFRRRSLKHESRSRRKPGIPGFFRRRQHSGTMPPTRSARRLDGRIGRLPACRLSIKQQLREARNNLPGPVASREGRICSGLAPLRAARRYNPP